MVARSAPAEADADADRPAVLPFPSWAVKGPARHTTAPPAAVLVMLGLDTWDLPVGLCDSFDAAAERAALVAADPYPFAARVCRAYGFDPGRLAGHGLSHVAVVEFAGPDPARRTVAHLYPPGSAL